MLFKLKILWILVLSSPTRSQSQPHEELGAWELARLSAKLETLEREFREFKDKIAWIEKEIALTVVSPSSGEEMAKNLSWPSAQEEAMKILLDQKKDPPLSSSYEENLTKARQWLLEGEYGQAYLSFSQIEKDFPQTGDGLYGMGCCWIKLKEYKMAEELLEKFMKKFPQHASIPGSFYYLAEAYWKQGKKSLAIENLQKILKNYPENSYKNLALKLLQEIRSFPTKGEIS